MSIDRTSIGKPRPPVPHQPHPEPRTVPWAVIVTVLSIILGTGLLYIASNDSDDQPDSTALSVPALASVSQEEAEQRLRNLGLLFRIITEPSVSIEVGNVIRTSPPAGTPTQEGTEIVVVVSGQPTSGVVPSVVGQQQAQAQSILSQSGLQSTIVQRADSAAAGTVVEQSPAAGTTIAPGSTVVLTVSTGPAVGTPSAPAAPSTQVAVPNVVGLDVTDAGAALVQAGLRLGTVTYQSSLETPGTIIQQDPPAGTLVASGSAVSLSSSQ